MNADMYREEALPFLLSPGGTRIKSSKWWLALPDKPTALSFRLKQRLLGPMTSHTGCRLGFLGRLVYGWLITDDPYFVRVDQELKEKGL